MTQGFIFSGFASKTAGDTVQTQFQQTGAVATGTNTMFNDDTIPQITEGDQYLSISITPTNVNSTLRIQVVANYTVTTSGTDSVMALFQGSTIDAIAAITSRSENSGISDPRTILHTITAGTTSSITFSVRIGRVGAGTTTFNGFASGRSMGGVMASSITVQEIASGSLIRETGNTGTIVQVVATETGAVATGSTAIPLDDTIPQNTEGNQFMSLAITPTNSSNKLLIEADLIMGSNSSGATYGCGLFQDSIVSAIAATANEVSSTDRVIHQYIRHYMTAGTTSLTTFNVRLGNDSGATTTFNGRMGARLYGGVMASTMTITEIKV